MTPEWTLYVRDPQYRIQGQLDDYQSLELVHRWRDVGAFSLDINRNNPHTLSLTTPGWGIVVKCGDVTVFSGPVAVRKHDYDGRQHKVHLSGMDDNVWLRRRLVSPSPSESFPPYTSAASDVRSGYASTVLRQYVDVNLGPGAVASRRKANFQIGADPLAGNQVTGRGRWQNLLTLLQELATAGGSDIGFRTLQAVDVNDVPTIEFQAYRATDRTETVKFSPDLGNLAAFSYHTEAPDANYVFVGGQGEGIARTIVERLNPPAISRWERIEGEFIDRRDVATTSELNQAGDEALEQTQEKGVMSLTPIDTPQQTYSQHYYLGDKVSIEWGEGSIRDTIREVKVNLTPDGPQTIAPSVGNVSLGDVSGFFRTFRRLRGDIVNLKRR